MHIVCRLECQVTEKKKGGLDPFEIVYTNAEAYINDGGYKVEFRLKICRHVDGDDVEDLKVSDWFVKSKKGTLRNISVCGTTFTYSETDDRIFIDRDFDEV